MGRLKHKTEGILNYLDYRKASGKIAYAAFFLVLLLFALLAVLPPIWLFISSFKTAAELYELPYHLFPAHFDIKKLGEIWSVLRFEKYILNSVLVILGAVACAVVFNGLLAYAISVVKPKGYKVVYALVMAGMMIPAITSMVPLFKSIVALNLQNSFVPLWLVFGANAYYFVLFKTYFDGLPRSLIEAAGLDGCNKLQIFFHLIAPLSKPILGVVAIFTVNAAWSDFLLPFLVLSEDSMSTVMVKIYALQSTMGTIPNFGPDKLLMVLTISLIPPVLFFAFFQKQITGSVSTSGMKD